VLSSLTRIAAFFSKWMAEIIRQPALMLSLVVGPFLVLLLFGQGIDLGGPRPKAIVVRPADQGDQPIDPLPEELDEVEIVEETTDLASARESLRQGEADTVVVIPPDPLESIQRGEQAPIDVYTNEIDPVARSYFNAYLNDQVSKLNQQAIQKAIESAMTSVDDMDELLVNAREFLGFIRGAGGDLEDTREQVTNLQATLDPLGEAAQNVSSALSGFNFVVPGLGRPSEQAEGLAETVGELQEDVDVIVSRLDQATGEEGIPTNEELDEIERNLDEVAATVELARSIPPEVLASPFDLEIENVAPEEVSYVEFYGPAVLALLLQHLGITLGALSMARMRLLGLLELLRTSPTRPVEVVVGNYLSYGVVCAVAGAALVALLVLGLGVPVFGSWLVVAGMLTALILCSLGIGFVISLLSTSEQQAAQLAMLVLIASVFFSDFIVSLELITWPVKAVAYVLPATYGIRSLQDAMLRDVFRYEEDLLIVGGAAIALFAASVFLFRREYRPR
jgi:ABC-2 type transport system permease protein